MNHTANMLRQQFDVDSLEAFDQLLENPAKLDAAVAAYLESDPSEFGEAMVPAEFQMQELTKKALTTADPRERAVLLGVLGQTVIKAVQRQAEEAFTLCVDDANFRGDYAPEEFIPRRVVA